MAEGHRVVFSGTVTNRDDVDITVSVETWLFPSGEYEGAIFHSLDPVYENVNLHSLTHGPEKRVLNPNLIVFQFFF